MELPPLIKINNNKTQHPTMLNKKKSYDDSDGSEYEDNNDDDNNEDDNICADLVAGKRGTSVMKGIMQNMKELCKKREHKIRRLKLEITKLKSHGCTMKQKMWEDYQWNGEDAILVDNVSDWVKNYLFPCYKFLKRDGWISRRKRIACRVLSNKRWGPAFPSHRNTETSGIG